MATGLIPRMFGKLFGTPPMVAVGVPVLRSARARRVIFFYPGEEGTYVDNCDVTLFANGIVHLRSAQEETTTHLQNCEILWNFEAEGEDRAAKGEGSGSKIRLLKPKGGEPAVKPNAPEPTV